jgi:hypothetical protein
MTDWQEAVIMTTNEINKSIAGWNDFAARCAAKTEHEIKTSKAKINKKGKK